MPPRAFHSNWALRAPICGRRFAPFREGRFAPLAGAASPPPLLMVFTMIIMLRLIMNRFIIVNLNITKGDVECGSMRCPFGLPAKWLTKKGL